MSAKKDDKNKKIKKQQEAQIQEEIENISLEGEDAEKVPCENCKEWEVKYEDLSDKYMRLAAEYDNFRRRSQKEKQGIYSDSVVDVATAWLPVIDNLERAILVSEKYKTEDAKKIAQGVEMIIKQAKETMENLGIEEIDALNAKFDPNTMEAVMHIQDDELEESTVVEVFEKGYIRGEKVIRHAMVKVAN